MAAEETPALNTPTKVMKDRKEAKTAMLEALRMPHQLTSMDEDDMPTPKAKVMSEDNMPTPKAKTSAGKQQETTANEEKEPSPTNSQKEEENLKDAKRQTNKEATDDKPTPKQSTQQSKTKTFEEKTRFSKVVPPTSLISICIDIPSNILIKVKNAAFEVATAFGLILTLGMLVVIVAVFIVPDYIWNRIWPEKPLHLKGQMEKQNCEEKELGDSDSHRRLLSDEISDLELEKVGMKASKEKGKGKEIIAEEKTTEVRDEKAS